MSAPVWRAGRAGAGVAVEDRARRSRRSVELGDRRAAQHLAPDCHEVAQPLRRVAAWGTVGWAAAGAGPGRSPMIRSSRSWSRRLRGSPSFQRSELRASGAVGR